MSTHDNNIHNDDLDTPMPDDAACGVGDQNEGNLDLGVEEEDEPRNSIDDMSDDAQALASAGWGTDEDYNGGCFGGEE